MNKNFAELNEYYIFEDGDQKDVFDSIKKMETMIKENNLEYFGTELRKATEIIFDSLPELEAEGSLKAKISTLMSNFQIPTNVLDGLFTIKNISNRESHSSYAKKSDRKYKIDISAEECNISLRNLWLFLKWISIEIKNIDELEGLSYSTDSKDNSFSKELNSDVENINSDISAEQITMSQLIFTKNFKFNIPTYQRDYTWREKNVSRLMKDIQKRKNDNKTHYFGSLAIAVEKEENALRIIDGQQRITTSLILMKVFFDLMDARRLNIPTELKAFADKKIKNIYINQDVLTSQISVRMLLGGGSFASGLSKIPFENYRLMHEFMNDMDNEELVSMYSSFTTKFEVATLVFKTTLDNEMDIFENLNTGGTQLSDWDLIRSYIFSRVLPKEFRENEKVIDRHLLRTLIEPINAATNNKPKTVINTFFTIYDRYINAIEKSQVFKGKTYDGFKEIWPTQKEKIISVEAFQESLLGIKKIQNCFMELKHFHKQNTSPLHPYSHIVSLINRDDFIVILIREMVNTCSFDEDDQLKSISQEFIKTMRIIETYFMRANLYGNNQKTLVDNFLCIHKENISNVLFEYLQTNSSKKMMAMSELGVVMSTSSSWQQAELINMVTHLELSLRGIQEGKSGYNKYEKTHEHIIAQKLSYENYGGEKISEKDFIEKRDARKNSLGNALLLTLGDNAKAGNRSFENKKEIYKKSSKLAVGSKGSGIMDLTEKKFFTFKDIENRAKQLSKYILREGIYYDNK